ncbi:DHA2 family efflux MFS transporter permease subunit [Nocardioides cavernaquae]|uniref:DHA2 family efflux MFS transporter permease subunit n=1 Tax=Nocardioides cavernaquae TaxID=2321396 RepID=A0A3A5H580_9ACTN|nr:DHA2 family efflux MFS transporter permease subunit [Nocardioides cavernaquae]RJS45849.1 DHA2 family efflux MFS transporter permease subunit [Nocardioides cavernaquae]
MTTDLTQDPPAESGPASDALPPGTFLVAGVVVLGAIMSILDITVVSVALQTFQTTFNATSAQVAWTMTGYTLALAAVIPLTGWAADRFGTKRLFILAVLLFTLGSALCASAPNLETLVGFRVLQGLGGGMLMPLGMTIMTHKAGPQNVGRVMAILGIPMMLGPICGPILGGWLVDSASWHWIFLVNVPIGVLTIIYASMVLPKDDVEPSETFDFLGMLLLSPGLATLLYGVSSIPGAKQEHGTIWTTEVVAFTIIGALLVAAFVPWALNRRNKHPLIDLHLFRDRQMTVAVVAMALFAMAFFGAGLLFPLYFQQVLGENALGSGLLLIPQGLGAVLTMPIAGVLSDKIGPGKVVLTGIVLDTIGLAFFINIGADPSTLRILAGLFIMGLGMGCTMMPMFSAALATLRHEHIARGSTLLNVTQQVAASIGTAIFAVILTNGFVAREEAVTLMGLGEEVARAGGPERADPSLLQQLVAATPDGLVAFGEAFGSVFLVGTILVGLCFIPALFLPRHKVAPLDPAAMIH